MTDANAQGTAAHTQPTSDSSGRTAPNRPAAITRHYDAPDADCVRGSEYSEILALETERVSVPLSTAASVGLRSPSRSMLTMRILSRNVATASAMVTERATVTTSTKTADWRIFAATSPIPLPPVRIL